MTKILSQLFSPHMHKEGWLMLCLLSLTTTFVFLIIFESPNLFSIPINLIFHRSPLLTKHHHTGREGRCDLSKGRWVRDWRGPLYTRKTCNVLYEGVDCEKYGKDMDYTNWRWKPDGCELPRFDAERFLSIVRGKRMAFIGDSIGRNQYSSLLCLLSQVAPLVDMMEDQVDKNWRAFHFPSHNFTLTLVFSHFLVEAWSDFDITTDGYVLAVDSPEFLWTTKLRDLHYIVLSNGPWFLMSNYLVDRDGNFIGCTHCNDDNRKRNATTVSASFAIQRVFTTALQHIKSCSECEENGLLTIVRLATPSHFTDGGWYTSGTCNWSVPISEGDVHGLLHEDISFHENLEIRSAQRKVMRRFVNGNTGSTSGSRGKMRFVDMDVTKAMLLRPDGHPADAYPHRKYNPDCLHWCLPGPVDFWNDVLLDILESQQ